MISRMKCWLIAPLLSLVSVLSACTGASDDHGPSTDHERSTDHPQPMNVPTDLFRQFEALGYQCVPRDPQKPDLGAGKCAAVIDNALRLVSFATSGDKAISWQLYVTTPDDLAIDPEAVDGTVRPVLELLAGGDIEQAINHATEVAADPEPNPGVEDPAVSGSEYQLTASNSDVVGLTVQGIQLGLDPMSNDPFALSLATFAAADGDALNNALTAAGMICDAAMPVTCEGPPRVNVMVLQGLALSVSIWVHDDQKAVLETIAAALNDHITTDGDFTDVLGETAEGASRYVRVVGDFLFYVAGGEDSDGHYTVYVTQ